MSNRYKLSAAAAALLVLSTPFAVHAQQTTATLRGVVSDASGAPVAGAKVTIIHTPSGTSQVTRTDAAGNYEASGLKVGGPYEVDIEAKGLTENKTGGVYLNLGDQQTLNIALQGGTTVVTVTGKRTTLANPGSRTTLRRDALEGVVTIKRDIREAARRDPLTQLDPATRGTGPSGGLYIAGSAPRANRITIDGVRSHDDFGLNTGGLSTNRGPISLEAVDQMTVQAVPADVEEGDFTGGALNLVLRSGSNTFHGSAFDYYRDAHMVQRLQYSPATGAFIHLKPYVPDKNYGFFLSGPILKDRLFFAASYEKYKSAAVTLAGPSDGGFGVSLVDNSGAPLTTAGLNALIAPWNNYAASSYLKPGKIDSTTPVEDEKYTLKLDWNVAPGHRISSTYRYAFSSSWKSQPTSKTAANLDTDWYIQPETENNISVESNDKWTNNFSTEARLAYRRYHRGQLPPEGQGFSTISICTDSVATSTAAGGNLGSCTSGKTVVNFGPDQFRHANDLRTGDFAGQFIGTYHLNSHSLKAGYQFKTMTIYNLFVPQANGLYYFDTPSDLASGRVDQFTYSNAPSGKPDDAAARFKYTLNTLLAQDTFEPMANMTVNYGLRYDFWTMKDLPALNASFTKTYGFNNQKSYDGLSVLEPRAGAKWHNDTFDASASFGLYTGGLPDVFLGNRFSNTGALSTQFQLRRLLGTTDILEVNSSTTIKSTDPIYATASALLNPSLTDSTFAKGSPALATSLISSFPLLGRVAVTNSLAPNFKMPSDWKLNFSGHWHAPWGTTFGIDGVYSQSQDGLAFKDLRARHLTINGQQQLTPDGRIRYDGLAVAATVPSTSTTDQKNVSIYAARQAAKLDVATYADGTPDYDLANVGGGYDIQAYNPSTRSTATTVALSAMQTFENLHWFSSQDVLDVSAAITHQTTNQYGGLPEFATTDCCGGSNYGDQFSLEDPNAPTKGKSTFEIRNGYKFNVNFRTSFFKNAPTTFTLFGDIHEGRPLNLYMYDSTSGRGNVFGVVSQNQLAFIPQLTTQTNAGVAAPSVLEYDTMSNGTNVPVFFANTAGGQTKEAAFAAMQNIVKTFGLAPGEFHKGNLRNPDVKRWDLHVAQDIPMPVNGHKLTATMDIFNVGNLLNKKWGTVMEYTGGRGSSPATEGAFKVSCGDASGTIQPSTSTVCQSYVIQSVSTSIVTPTVNPDATLYSVMFGLKYSF